jgi:diguanylate cyclase (GGDEF)-like protein
MFRAVDINILAAVVSAIILTVVAYRREKNKILSSLFIIMCSLNIVLNVLEALGMAFSMPSGADGPSYRALDILFHTLLYALSSIPVSIWLLYVHYQLFHSLVRLRRALFALGAVLLADALAAVLSIRTGWYFTVDPANHYHRGILYPVHILVIYSILAAACLLAVVNRSRLEKRFFRAILLFAIPPVIGSALQVLFYGLMLNWVFLTISLLIVCLYIQNSGLITDILTGTYNRRHFERLIREKMRRSDTDQSFAVILADMDNFKRINDQYGHKAGDEALQIAVELMRRVLRHNDLIARFGGDEFYIMLDLSSEAVLVNIIRRIYVEFENYNRKNIHPFLIELSLGGSVYIKSAEMPADQFLLKVDQLMYQEKMRRAASRPAG